LGIVTLIRLVPANAEFPMLVTLWPIRTLVRTAQFSNAPIAMLVTLWPILTLVTLELLANAPDPMLVTGRPMILLGTVTAPPGPVYPVMVIVSLLIVYANWAFTAAGSTQSIIKKNSLGQQANPVLRLCLVLAMQR